MGDLWFTADTHFGHANIIKHAGRPFRSAAEMDEALIQLWNETVKPQDTVWHLGDFMWSVKPTEWVVRAKELHGHLRLVVGNHDTSSVTKKLKKWGDSSGFERIEDLYFMKLGDRKRAGLEGLVLCHYPMVTWNKKHFGVVHLHGHCHGSLQRRDRRAIDVGVDTHMYRPYNFDEIVTLVENAPIVIEDHHTRR